MPATSPPPTTTTVSTSSQSTHSTVASTSSTNTLPAGFEPISTKPTTYSSTPSTGATRQQQKSSKSSQGSSKPSPFPYSQSQPPVTSKSSSHFSSKVVSSITRKAGTQFAVTPQARPQGERICSHFTVIFDSSK